MTWVVWLWACASRDPVDITLPADEPLPLDAEREGRVDDLLAGMSLDEAIDLLAGVTPLPQASGWRTAGWPGGGLAGFAMTDGPRGVGLADGQTVFPVGVARAASFDPSLERRIMAAMGAEAAWAGKDTLLAPTLNLVRHPLWGRAQESYGEEPWLLGAMASAGVQGAQAHVLATPKHFAVNSIEGSRYVVDMQLDPRVLHEVYLPHFRQVVREADPAFVMAAYNRVNGDFCAESRPLLTEILRETWGFQGVVMSDWIHGVEDGVKALQAGLDLEMPVADAFAALPDALAAGEVSEELVWAAARRHLRVALRRDALPAPVAPDAAAHRALAREAAAAGTVLLVNDGLLPLAGAPTVAVVGRLADTVNTGDRGSSHVDVEGVVTPWAGLSARLGPDAVGVLTDTPSPAELDAVAAADVAVVVVGLTWAEEGECIIAANACDRETLALPEPQRALIDAVLARQARVVVVLQGSGAIDVEGFYDRVGALLMTWYAGHEGGHALADVLFGDVDPGGRLPVVFPRRVEDLPFFDPISDEVRYGLLHGGRWLEARGVAPRFPVGHGLSYATFSLEDADVEVPPALSGPLTVRARVRNTARRGGVAVLQAWLRGPDGDVERPPRVLGGAARVTLAAGDDADVDLTIDPRWLARYDDGAWIVDGGPWTVELGWSAGEVVEGIEVGW